MYVSRIPVATVRASLARDCPAVRSCFGPDYFLLSHSVFNRHKLVDDFVSDIRGIFLYVNESSALLFVIYNVQFHSPVIESLHQFIVMLIPWIAEIKSCFPECQLLQSFESENLMRNN